MWEDLIPPGSKVLCAVSGGADSMCLLHMLSQREDMALVAAHFNHQLRGEESDRDEAFVRDVCARWNIPLTVGRGDVKAFSEREGLSLEEGGRILRYAFLEGAAQTEGCDLIATAHNADDNLETMLLNLTRGAGLSGLAGIPPQRGNIVRPLLTTTRREIEEYLRLYSLPHVEDSTNADETYSRNKMRRQVLPLLEEFNPALRKNSIDAIRYLRADNDYLNGLASDLSKKAVVEDDTVALPAIFISGSPRPVAIRAVRQLLSMMPDGSTDCAAAHLEGVVNLCQGDDPSAVFHLPHGVTARREYDRLILTLRSPPPALEPMTLLEGENPVPGTAWTVVLDGPPWPGLMVRPRRTGDEITLSNGHKKSLKKLFIDRKVPRLERERVPVAADDDGVIAVAGLGSNLSHPCRRQVRIIEQRKGEAIYDKHER